MRIKKHFITASIGFVASSLLLVAGACSASSEDKALVSSSGHSEAQSVSIAPASELTFADGESTNYIKFVQMLQPVNASQQTDIKLTPDVIGDDTTFATAECPRAAEQHEFSAHGSWPGVTFKSAKVGDQKGYYIHVAQVPLGIMARVTVSVDDGSEARLVDTWRVFSMPPGHGGVEDFFLPESYLGEYPDNAVSFVLACGNFNP